jgi:hypothetical protein
MNALGFSLVDAPITPEDISIGGVLTVAVAAIYFAVLLGSIIKIIRDDINDGLNR